MNPQQNFQPVQLPQIVNNHWGLQLPLQQFPQILNNYWGPFPQQLPQQVPQEEGNKITKNEICDILTQDSYYRKLKQWPLLTSKEFLSKPIFRDVDKMFHTRGYRSYNNLINTSISVISDNINGKFPHIIKLLQKFNKRLIACGGAVTKAISGRLRGYGSDIDLFFYGLSIEEADKIRLEAIEFLINSWMEYDPNLYYHIKRNEYTTTVFVSTDEYEFFEYQFIHRIYPTIDSIIGGFDLSICMVAYDGKEIYATPLGAWSIKNKSIIIDTKRRSTSFEYRLQKYRMNGFRLIFPGISYDLILNFDSKSQDMFSQMINKMRNIAKEYGYVYNDNSEDFDYKGGELPENNRYNLQKKENILPYFKLDSLNVRTVPYDRKNIEDRLLNKISDYSSLSSHPKCFVDINAQQLRSDNLHAVSSILKLDTRKNIKEQLINDIDNPNLMIDDLVISKFNERVDRLRLQFIHRRDTYNNYSDSANKNIDFYKLLKCFGKLTPKVIEVRDTDEYYQYRDMIVNKMMTNAEICMKNLIGIKWITQDPGRQWTSSINPIIADPRDWYGKHYEPVITGIPLEIETIMRLMRLEKTQSVWTIINDDIFREICLHLFKKYADDAWEYI